MVGPLAREDVVIVLLQAVMSLLGDLKCNMALHIALALNGTIVI